MIESFQDRTSSTNSNEDAPKFGEGLSTNNRLTAKNVADEAGRLFRYFEDRLKHYDPKIQELTNSVNFQAEELKRARTDNANSLAVFVAFFTFVSISYSILPRILNPLILLGILLALLGSLISFVLLIAWVLSTQKEGWFTKKQIVIGLLSGILVFSGSVLSWLGYKDMKSNDFYTQDQVDSLLSEQRDVFSRELEEAEYRGDKKIAEFKNCIATQGIWKCLSI